MPRHLQVSSHLGSNKMVGKDFRIVGKRIGAGNFGEVRIGENTQTHEKVAIKIERIANPKGVSATIRLKHEYDMLRKIYHGFPKGHKINGIPRFHYFGKCGSVDCLVLDLLGTNLEDLFELVGQLFSMKTVLMIAFQLLDRIETVHQRGLVYRDVKPENFLLGKKDSEEFNIIHMVDFGLATFYRDPQTGKHLPFRDLKTMTGTARYMSVHSHLGKAQSRRDDLESIGYVLIYFAKGKLPWQGIKTNNLKEKYKKIRDAKMKFPLHVLCDGLPKQFQSFMSYVKKLGFSETPDYEFLKDLFHELYEECGFSYDDSSFDWTHLDLPNDVQRFNQNNKDGIKESDISSFNTENSQHFAFDDICDNDADVKDEAKDKLGELRDIRDQTKAMEGIVNSRKNVRSLSISNSNLGLESSETDFGAGDGSNNLNPKFNGLNGSQSYSQGYFSNDGSEPVGPINKSNHHGHQMHYSSGVSHCDEIQVVTEEPHSMEANPICELHQEKGRCTEACTVDERMSFLCFTWRKRKKDITYHTFDAQKCQGQTRRGY
ncbi:casein kinase I-like [Tigriopus californicus]|uniref:casein kinase I-like n=1 Tax=Tigriopus californicus TaxID=6832 RepID=UPI0027D9D4A4|nr:casein kinase I-like [Tigriopus californicus]